MALYLKFGAGYIDLQSAANILEEQRRMIATIQYLSDVGRLFDGHDELNEHTHKENEEHLTAALDKIHDIVTGKIAPKDI